MGRAVLWFILSCKRQLKRPVFAVLLLLLPLVSWLSVKAAREDESGIAVGVCAQGEWSEELAKYLYGQEGMFRFYPCGSLEELKGDVSSRKAECGFYLPGDLKENLDRGDFGQSVTVYSAPSTVAAQVTKEVVFATLIELYGRELLKDFVTENEIFAMLPAEETWDQVEQLYDKYMGNGSTFSFLYEVDRNGSAKKPAAKAVFPVRGIVSVYLFVVGLFSAVALCADEKKGLFIPVPCGQKLACRLAGMAAPVMLAGIFALISLGFSDNLNNPAFEIAAMAVYGIVVTLFSYLMKLLLKSPVALCSVIPFFVIGSLLLCPVFTDIARWIPQIGWMGKAFLPYYYLRLFY